MIKRRRYGSGFVYHINGAKVPSVTQVTGMLPSKNLIDWAANTTADYAIDHLAELSEMAPSIALNTLRRSRYLVTNPAKRRGTEVHRLAEPAMLGDPVDVGAVPEELRGYVEAYLDFLDVIDPQPVALELTVASLKRPHRYAGRLDLIADLPAVQWDGRLIPAGRWLLDLKTGEKGVYAESALQLCGYQHADVFAADIDGGKGDPDERPVEWLRIERCGVVHLSSDAWELRPVETGEQVWKAFKFLLWLRQLQDADQMKEWIGSPIEPVPALISKAAR
jgi:hypothetical protein